MHGRFSNKRNGYQKMASDPNVYILSVVRANSKHGGLFVIAKHVSNKSGDKRE